MPLFWAENNRFGKMWEKPVEQNEHCDKKEHRFREENPEKFLSTPNFIIKGFKSEAERIQVSQLTI